MSSTSHSCARVILVCVRGAWLSCIVEGRGCAWRHMVSALTSPWCMTNRHTQLALLTFIASSMHQWVWQYHYTYYTIQVLRPCTRNGLYLSNWIDQWPLSLSWSAANLLVTWLTVSTGWCRLRHTAASCACVILMCVRGAWLSCIVERRGCAWRHMVSTLASPWCMTNRHTQTNTAGVAHLLLLAACTSARVSLTVLWARGSVAHM